MGLKHVSRFQAYQGETLVLEHISRFQAYQGIETWASRSGSVRKTLRIRILEKDLVPVIMVGTGSVYIFLVILYHG